MANKIEGIENMKENKLEGLLKDGIIINSYDAKDIVNVMERDTILQSKGEMIYQSSIQAKHLSRDEEFEIIKTSKELKTNDIVKIVYSGKQKDAEESAKSSENYAKKELENANKSIKDVENKLNENENKTNNAIDEFRQEKINKLKNSKRYEGNNHKDEFEAKLKKINESKFDLEYIIKSKVQAYHREKRKETPNEELIEKLQKEINELKLLPKEKERLEKGLKLAKENAEKTYNKKMESAKNFRKQLTVRQQNEKIESITNNINKLQEKVAKLKEEKNKLLTGKYIDSLKEQKHKKLSKINKNEAKIKVLKEGLNNANEKDLKVINEEISKLSLQNKRAYKSIGKLDYKMSNEYLKDINEEISSKNNSITTLLKEKVKYQSITGNEDQEELLSRTKEELRNKLNVEGFTIDYNIYSDKLQKKLSEKDKEYNKRMRNAEIIEERIELEKELKKSKSAIIKENKDEITTVTKHYSLMKRTTAQARVGNEYYLCDGIVKDGKFIGNKMFNENREWFSCGLWDIYVEAQKKLGNETKLDVSGFMAYCSMVDSGCEKYLTINPRKILVLPEVEAIIKMDKVKAVGLDENGWLKSFLQENGTTVNALHDGQALLDNKFFEEGQSMQLLRNHFFKSAGFNTNIQQFYKDYCNKNKLDYDTFTVKDVFGKDVLVKDIEMITNVDSLKIYKVFGKENSLVRQIAGEKFGYERPMTDYDVFDYWCKCIEEDGNRMGVVKHEKVSKFIDEELDTAIQKMAYQMVNTFPEVSEDEMIKILEREIKFVEKLKNNDEVFIKYLKDNSNFSNKYQDLIDEVERNIDFIHTRPFATKRSKIISNYVNDLKKARFKQTGDNLVLVGNPMEQLLLSVKELPIKETNNKFKVVLDDTYKSVFGESKDCNKALCYTKQFEDGCKFTGFRSPHSGASNIGLFDNVQVDEIDNYFNFSKNIIAVDLTKVPVQDILNGSDQDSDFILAVKDELTRKIAERKIGKNYTVKNILEPVSTGYKFTNEDIARLDYTLAKSQLNIGRTANLAQISVSQLNHYEWLIKNCTDEKELTILKRKYNDLMEINDILNIMEGMAIDSSKRLYSEDPKFFEEQLNHLLDADCWIKTDVKTNNGKVVKKIVAPQFFDLVAPNNTLPREKMHTPVDMIENVVKTISQGNYNANINYRDLFDLTRNNKNVKKNKANDLITYAIKHGQNVNGIKQLIRTTTDKNTKSEYNKTLEKMENEFETMCKGYYINSDSAKYILSESFEKQNSKYQDEIRRAVKLSNPSAYNSSIKKNVKAPNVDKAKEVAVDSMDNVHSVADKTLVNDFNFIDEAVEDINNRIKKTVKNFGLGVTEEQAKKILNEKLSKEEYDEVKKLFETMEDCAEKDLLLKKINAPSYRARLTREESLKNDLLRIKSNLREKMLNNDNNMYTKVIEDSYYKGLYNIEKSVGISIGFNHITEKDINDIKNSFCDIEIGDKHFQSTFYSGVEWNSDVFEEKAVEVLQRNLTSGNGVYKMCEDMKDLGLYTKNATIRLMRTETTHYYNQANIKSYEECGIEKYKFVATLDMRTSSICQGLDGKIFNVKDAQQGVNLAPMHYHCRSTSVAVYDDEVMDNMKRRAKDKDGNSYIVENMTYSEWKEKYNI